MRTAAIDAIIKDYPVLLGTLEEIVSTTKDDHGLKAGGVLHSLETFNTLFGLKLAHLLFSAAEQVSLTLQRKDNTLQDAVSAIGTAKAYYYQCIRSEEEFDRL